MRLRAASCLLLLLPLTACSGGADEEGFPEADLSGACAVLQPDLDALAALGPELTEGDRLSEASATALEQAQSNLTAAAPDLPLEASAAVDQLVTRLGLVRLSSDAGRLQAARDAMVQEGYQEVLSACADAP